MQAYESNTRRRTLTRDKRFIRRPTLKTFQHEIDWVGVGDLSREQAMVKDQQRNETNSSIEKEQQISLLRSDLRKTIRWSHNWKMLFNHLKSDQ